MQEPIGFRRAMGARFVRGERPGVCAQCATIGSQMSHWASTSSLRVKSVASPRIASRISRS